MSLHYLLDGYNIIHQIPALAQERFDEAREAFLKLVETSQPQGSFRNKVTVVFDGKPGIWNFKPSPYIEIIFTHSQSADDKIKDMVAQAANAKAIVVVTDDRDIQYAVRGLGAKVVGVSDFVAKLQEPRGGKPSLKNSKKGPAEIKKYIPTVTEFKINEELKNIWLHKERKKNY